MSGETKQVLLSAFVKLLNAHPQLAPQITELIQKQTTTMDAELQQRAVEYLALAQVVVGHCWHSSSFLLAL